jgi:hypothetical protein
MIEASGAGQLASDHVSVMRRLSVLAARQVELIGERGASLFGPLTTDGLEAEFSTSPHRVKLLFQAIAFGCTEPILVMLWLGTAAGVTIKSIEYTFKDRLQSELRVQLQLPAVGARTFHSRDHRDTAALRFAGIAIVNDAPTVDGFFPLRVASPPADLAEDQILRLLELVQMHGGRAVLNEHSLRGASPQQLESVLRHAVVNGLVEPSTEGDLDLAQGVEVQISHEGRRELRRHRFRTGLQGASYNGLRMLQTQLDRVLAAPDPDYTSDDIEEFKDERHVVGELLGRKRPA